MAEKTPVASEVNRLYWETADSVGEISNGLGISRRALYELIEPMPTGVECSSCGAELYFSNRSAKAAGVARCVVCGNEKDIEAPQTAGTVPPYGAGWPAVKKPMRNDARDRVAMIAGFAIAGVAIGAVATMIIRKRR